MQANEATPQNVRNMTDQELTRNMSAWRDQYHEQRLHNMRQTGGQYKPKPGVNQRFDEAKRALAIGDKEEVRRFALRLQ